MKLPFKVSRRQFLVAGLSLFAGSAGAVYYACRVEPHWVEFVRRDLPIAGLPGALEGKTLVQLSDLHVGPQVSDDFLVRNFELVAALEPDIVVVTGDYMTCKSTEELPHVARTLRHLPHGKLATLGILGNHDYGCTWQVTEVGDQLACLLETLGVQILRNEHATVAGLHVVGLDDLWSKRWEGPAAVSKLPPGPALVLCHQPDGVDHPGWGSYDGWILSGHTHGGQCKPPFLRPPVCPVINKRYVAGEYDVGGGRRLYINRGLGHIIQARFNARPEVTVFRLTAAG
jgi:predicted MPP superfamily phosphohydrolase